MFDQSRGHLLTPDDLSDPFDEHEAQFAGSDFLVELHGGKKSAVSRRIELHVGGQAGAHKQIVNPPHVARRKACRRRRQAGRGHLANGDRFTMEKSAVM